MTLPAPILVTGVAGFIGSHVARRLVSRGEAVIGIDNLNAYNPVALKQDRLAAVAAQTGGSFDFHRVDFADMAARVSEQIRVRLVELGDSVAQPRQRMGFEIDDSAHGAR